MMGERRPHEASMSMIMMISHGDKMVSLNWQRKEVKEGLAQIKGVKSLDEAYNEGHCVTE